MNQRIDEELRNTKKELEKAIQKYITQQEEFTKIIVQKDNKVQDLIEDAERDRKYLV